MNEKKNRTRLDSLLVERQLCRDLKESQARIMSGEVFDANGQRLDKGGESVSREISLEIRSKTPAFASRGGHKLEHALQAFNVVTHDRVCLDVGSSTGGFTDCLLKHGARHVFSVDVGYGLLDQKLRNHPNVTPLEKTNARYLKREDLQKANPLASHISLIVMDVSFISLRTIVEPLSLQFPERTEWVLLFKPQFEVDPKFILDGGIVKNNTAIRDAIEQFQKWMSEKGFKSLSAEENSPLRGKRSGNLEHLLFYEKNF